MVSAVGTYTPQPNAKSADGDYKTANAQSSQIKDTDGDYKPTSSNQAATASATQATGSNATQATTASSTAASASSTTQAALYGLPLGGPAA